MTGKLLLRTRCLLLAALLCTLAGCGRINGYLAERAIANARRGYAAELSRGGELFLKAAVIDSLFSDSTRYLFLLPNADAGRLSTDGYATAAVTPGNSIVVYSCSDTTFRPSRSSCRAIAVNRLGLEFLQADEPRLLSIRKAENGYYIVTP